MHNSQKDPSPTPLNPPTQPPSQSAAMPLSQQMQELQMEVKSLNQWKSAVSQILWNLVRKYEPGEEQVVVSSIASDPLWQLAFVQADEKNTDPTKVRVLAGLLPPITEQEKKKVVRLLRGTDTPMIEALVTLGVPHPPSYVEKAIEAHLVWVKADAEVYSKTAGCWESVTPPSLAERAKNLLHLPKA